MNEVKKQLSTKLRRNIIYLGSALINVIFLCLWAFVQFGAAKFINLYINWVNIDDNFNTTMLYILRILIAISTLYPIAKNIYEDIIIMNLQTNQRIKKLAKNLQQ